MKKICKDCGKCCIETEMLLSNNDIALIKKDKPKHLKIASFVRKTEEGFNQLINVKGYCVFFDSVAKMCTIYDVRPQGCRFYPLIYDSDKKLCVLDHECPRPELFYPNKNSQVKTCRKIVKFLKKEVVFTKLR